jgi:hypothetical protein
MKKRSGRPDVSAWGGLATVARNVMGHRGNRMVTGHGALRAIFCGRFPPTWGGCVRRPRSAGKCRTFRRLSCDRPQVGPEIGRCGTSARTREWAFRGCREPANPNHRERLRGRNRIGSTTFRLCSSDFRRGGHITIAQAWRRMSWWVWITIVGGIVALALGMIALSWFSKRRD